MQLNSTYLTYGNGERFNTEPRHPEPVAKPFNKAAANQWVDAHPPRYRAALSELTEKVDFIRADHFRIRLTQSIEGFKRQLAEREIKDYTVLIEPGKSNQWVAELAYNQIPQSCKLTRLGIKDAQIFLTDLDKQSGPGRNVDVVPKNIVLFDDGSYSGTQITEHVSAIFENLKKNYNISNAKMPHVYVVIPFMTDYAVNRLTNAVKRLHLEDNLHVAPYLRMSTVADLSPDAQAKIQELYWPAESEGNKQHGLFYFAHKIPNSQSFPGPLAEGKVWRGIEKTAPPVVATFPVIPAIQPPYKNTTSDLA